VLTLAVAVAALVGCAPPGERAAGDGPLLYVVSAVDGAVTRVAPDSGRVQGAPIPAGTAPWQVLVGGSGHLLVAALVGVPRHGHLTFVERRERAWRARPLELGPGAHVTQWSGGGRYAVAAYGVASAAPGAPPTFPGPACALALIDLEAGAVVRTQGACAYPGEDVRAVALDGTADGPVLYAALWRDSRAAEGHGSTAGGRVVALDALSGRVLAMTALPGAPVNLVLAPAPGRAGQRLYAVEGRPTLAGSGGSADAIHAAGGTFALLTLDPVTLAVEAVLELGFPPDRLAVAPDGDHAYAVHGTDLVHLDLVTRRVARLRTLAPATQGLVVTETALFLALPNANAVWRLARRDGRLLHTIRVGRTPVGLTLQ
jgi:hypothetical protein